MASTIAQNYTDLSPPSRTDGAHLPTTGAAWGVGHHHGKAGRNRHVCLILAGVTGTESEPHLLITQTHPEDAWSRRASTAGARGLHEARVFGDPSRMFEALIAASTFCLSMQRVRVADPIAFSLNPPQARNWAGEGRRSRGVPGSWDTSL